MKFCENCNFLVEQSACPICKSTKLREAGGEDFCFYTDLDRFACEMFEAALKEHGVDAVCVPYYPMGVTYGNAGRAGGRHVYIRYKNFELADEVYGIIFGDSE